MRRIIKVILILVLACICVGYFLLFTHQGWKYSLEWAQHPLQQMGIHYVPEEIHGTLADATIPNLKIVTSSQSITIRSLRLKWSPTDLLFHHRFRAKWLAAEKIYIKSKPDHGKASTDLALPSLPFAIDITQLNIGKLRYNHFLLSPLKGQLQIQPRGRINVCLDFDNPQPNGDKLKSTLILTGDHTNYQGSVTLSILHDSKSYAHTTLNFSGSTHRFVLKPFAVDFADPTNRLSGQATMEWSPKWLWNINLNANLPNLNTILSSLPSENILADINSEHTQQLQQTTINLHTQQFTLRAHASSLNEVSRIDQLYLAVPRLGLIIRSGQFALTPIHNGVSLNGTTKIGDGTLKTQGSLHIDSMTPTIDLQFKGDTLNLLDIPSMQVVATPNIQYQRDRNGQRISGSLHIPKARINADKLHRDLSYTQDIIWLNRKGVAMQESPLLPLQGRFDVNLGKAVEFEGFGVTAKVKGQLMIHTQTDGPTLATGKLTLQDAAYQAYGRRFNIHNGQLIFRNSPIDNPDLNIVAEYTLAGTGGQSGYSNIQLGVHITGNVAKPKLTLFSHPSMSQENILSYMVLGIPLDQVQDNQKQFLSAAALTFASNGGNESIVSNIQSAIGIDEIQVGNIGNPIANNIASNPNSSVVTSDNDNSNTAIFVGKSITPRIYVSYGVGLFNQAQEIRTRIKLTPQLDLLTDHSDEYSGADLVWTFDY